MTSFRVTNRNNSLSHREEYLEKGTMLDELQYYVDWFKSGDMKMLVLTTMEGYLGTHVCYSCSNIIVDSKIARIAHFKCSVYNATYTKSD